MVPPQCFASNSLGVSLSLSFCLTVIACYMCIYSYISFLSWLFLWPNNLINYFWFAYLFGSLSLIRATHFYIHAKFMLIKMSKKQFMANDFSCCCCWWYSYCCFSDWYKLKRQIVYRTQHKHLLCALVVCLLIVVGLVTARSAWRGALLLERC